VQLPAPGSGAGSLSSALAGRLAGRSVCGCAGLAGTAEWQAFVVHLVAPEWNRGSFDWLPREKVHLIGCF